MWTIYILVIHIYCLYKSSVVNILSPLPNDMLLSADICTLIWIDKVRYACVLDVSSCTIVTCGQGLVVQTVCRQQRNPQTTIVFTSFVTSLFPVLNYVNDLRKTFLSSPHQDESVVVKVRKCIQILNNVNTQTVIPHSARALFTF